METHPFLSLCREVGNALAVRAPDGRSTAATTAILTAGISPWKTARTNASNKTYEGDELYLELAETSTTITSAITATATTATIASGTGLPTGGTNPFYWGMNSEIMLATRSTTTLTFVQRGCFETRAQAHASGSTGYASPINPNPQGIASYVASTGVFTPDGAWDTDPGEVMAFSILQRGVSLWDIRQAVNRALVNLRYRSEFPLTLVADGDMRANGTTNWTASNATLTKVTNSNAHRGPRSLRVLATSASGYAQSDTIFVDPTNAREWYVEARVRADVGTARLIAYDVTNSANIQTSDWALRGWGKLNFTLTLPATCEALAFQLMSVANNDDSYWSPVIAFPQGATEVPLPSWLQNKEDVLNVISDTADLDRDDDPRWRPYRWSGVKEDPGNPNNPFRLVLSPMTYGPVWFEAIRGYDRLAADAQTTFCDLEWVKLAAMVEVCKMQAAKPPSENRKHFKVMLDGPRRGSGLLHDLKVMNSTKLSTIYESQFARAY